MIELKNVVKVPQKNFKCISDTFGVTKKDALDFLEKSMPIELGLKLIPPSSSLADPCYWVEDKLGNCYPIGFHCQKFRRNTNGNRKGFWRVRVFEVKNYENNFVVQHKRHFEVLTIKNK